MAEAKADAIAPPMEGSKAAESSKESKKTKAATCTWAEYQATLKSLDSTNNQIMDLSWRLQLEKIRDRYGDVAVQRIFPSETWGKAAGWAMLSAMLLACKCNENHLDDERRSQGAAPHIKKMLEERSRLRLKYHVIRSGLRRPDFSGMSEADRAAEAERLREESLQRARRLLESGDPDDRRLGRRLEAEARVLDFDPKQRGTYHNGFVSLPTFDLAEESPIGPMRFTNKVFQAGEEVEFYDAVNILSVNVARSDVGFPVHVYGTVVARDCIDNKRVYLFHRDRQHCQVINSKDEALTLTGPKRGLVLSDDEVYVEIDLKIKDHQGQDRELSKGLLTISDVEGRSSFEKCEVGRLFLATRLSTVKVEYAIVVSAVEATVAIEVEEGEFYGIV